MKCVSHSVHVGWGFYIMSIPVWLPGPMFLLGWGSLCLVPCSFWKEISMPGPMFLLGGLCSGGFLSGFSVRSLCPGISVWGCFCQEDLCPGVSLSGRVCPGVSVQRDLCPGETPQTETSCTMRSGQYTSYWNAFLFIAVFLLISV